jgi:hypothetical protein
MHVMPRNMFANTQDPSMRKALMTAYTASQFYCEDVKTMVIKDAKISIADQKSSDEDTDRSASRQRQKALKEWSNMDHPLKGDAYSTIARMISANAVQIPEASPPKLHRKDFIPALVTSGRKTKVNGWRFISGGFFQHILPLALELIDQYANQMQLNEDELAWHVFTTAFITLHVNLLPGPPPTTGPGAQFTVPRWDRWSTFFGSGSRLIIHPTDARQRRTAMLQQRQDEVMANDQDSEWFACGITLQDIATVFNRTQRPADFLAPEDIDDKPGYIRDTYQYVYESLDFTKPLHMFALIYALVTINHVPAVFVDIPDKVNDSDLASVDKTKAFLQGLSWFDKTKVKRGTTQKDIFLTMVVTLIISFYDEKSPLRDYHKKNKKLGNDYTKKHGTIIVF